MIPSNWRVLLEGLDISTNVSSIFGISTDLDLERPTEFTTDSVRLEVNNINLTNLEYRKRVVIRVDGDIIFLGRILTITKGIKPRSADVVVSDDTQELREELIENFGISKRVRVTQVGDTDNGEYPFTNILAPVSDKSLADPISDGNALTIVDHFATEGNLEKTNINYDEDTLRSESESLTVNPDVTLKAPYRWKSIIFLVNKLLEHYNITTSDVFRDIHEVDYHFSTNGRVGYDLENNLDTANPLADGVETATFWTGQVTDFLIDNNKFYFLYSGRLSNPSIIEYDVLTDTYREVFKRDRHAEWWKFVKDGDTFYILGTTKSSTEVFNPVLGAYDPTEPNPATLIERLDVSTNTLSNYIDSTHVNRPVVGMYYQMGFAIDGANNNVRQGIQPDTRRSFILHNNMLYYAYANRLSCGIARATAANTASAFVVISRDSFFNHLGLDFTIAPDPDNGNIDTLFGGACFQKETESSRILYKKAI